MEWNGSKGLPSRTRSVPMMSQSVSQSVSHEGLEERRIRHTSTQYQDMYCNGSPTSLCPFASVSTGEEEEEEEEEDGLASLLLCICVE